MRRRRTTKIAGKGPFDPSSVSAAVSTRRDDAGTTEAFERAGRYSPVAVCVDVFPVTAADSYLYTGAKPRGVTSLERRTRAAQDRLRAVDAAGLVLSPGSNLRYLTGIAGSPSERLFVCLVPAAADPTLVVPELEAETVREATWIADVRTWQDGDGPAERLAEAIDELGSGRLLLDETMWTRFTLRIQELAGAGREYGLANEVLGPLRAHKDEDELDALRRASDVADRVMTQITGDAASFIGRSEADVAREIEHRLADAGGTGVSFEPIVAAGPNGAKPHHAHGDSRIAAGEPVVLDFGTRVDGYPSDTTRTVVFGGEPSAEFEKVHGVVREAQAAAVDRVEPGVEARTVDAAARGVIEDAGYGEAFIHRTGHGVGLDVHEEPYIASDADTVLEPGMVFSVEPGVYLEGSFGVRIEDLVVVTDSGCERLNESPRDWRV